MFDPLDVGLRIVRTLRFLATGNSHKSLGYTFCVAPKVISKIMPETCRAIITVYGDDVMKLPDTLELAMGFDEQWHLPHHRSH